MVDSAAYRVTLTDGLIIDLADDVSVAEVEAALVADGILLGKGKAN